MLLKKFCPRCKDMKPESDFCKAARTRDGLQPYCKGCSRLFRNEAYRKNPAKEIQKVRLKRRKCTPARFAELTKKQNGLCAICGEPETRVSSVNGKVQALAIDHCHAKNVVRGLLCWRCNVVLGHVKDDPQLLRKMASYLEGEE